MSEFERTTGMRLTRRGFLAGTGAAALAAGLPMPALAKGQVIVGTWGGDYQALLTANFEKPILEKKGIEVIHDISGAPPRKTKLLAERVSRRGTMDVACLSDIDMFEMSKQNLFDNVDPTKVPNAKNIFKQLAKPYAIPHIYSGKVLVYNPNKMSPTSFADFLDPKYKGRIGFADGLYMQIIESAALVNGGSMSNYEPGKATLTELKKFEPKVFPSNETLAAALKSEEVWATVMWRARGFMWKKAGIPLATIAPKEGTTPIIFDAAVPKNAQNKDNGWAYLDAMLDPGGQVLFADRMGYVPTVNNAKLPDDLAKEIGFTEAEQEKFNIPNYEYIAANNAALLEWWNKSFKA
ncbi:ABC transporter substrate-binding protein [Allostella sp. ATCC 35155]|nr:ABC transporter substrate-binding protein [Stella sp. ATCC 35155]